MGQWKQIGGDVNPKEYGAVLARVDGDYVEVVVIDPDDEGSGYHVVNADFDRSDLEWGGSAHPDKICNTIGCSKADWEKMSLADRGEAAVSYHGSGWSGGGGHARNWSSALPAESNQIKWWK